MSTFERHLKYLTDASFRKSQRAYREKEAARKAASRANAERLWNIKKNPKRRAAYVAELEQKMLQLSKEYMYSSREQGWQILKEKAHLEAEWEVLH